MQFSFTYFFFFQKIYNLFKENYNYELKIEITENLRKPLKSRFTFKPIKYVLGN